MMRDFIGIMLPVGVVVVAVVLLAVLAWGIVTVFSWF